MPAAIPIAIATVAAASIYQGVQSNQQAQHAKGAAQAQQTAMDNEIADQKKAQVTQQQQKADVGSSNQSAAIAALRASMSAGNSNSSILTGPSGAAPAPTQTKQLLGI